MKPSRGYVALRAHRVSTPGASYFVTLCTHDRLLGLTSESVANTITAELGSMTTDDVFLPRAWTIMPNHLHLFFTLNNQLTLGRIVGRLKAKTRTALAEANLSWQGNYYEHRLRPNDAVEEVLRYLFLNPYRSGLVRQSEQYPHFWLSAAEAEWFVPILNDNRPFSEWLRAS